MQELHRERGTIIEPKGTASVERDSPQVVVGKPLQPIRHLTACGRRCGRGQRGGPGTQGVEGHPGLRGVRDRKTQHQTTGEREPRRVHFSRK